MNEAQRDRDRLELLDRIEDRMPDVTWHGTCSSGPCSQTATRRSRSTAGGMDGGNGAYFANAGNDLHAIGSVAPLVPDSVGCIIIRPDGSRHLAYVMADPLAQADD